MSKNLAQQKNSRTQSHVQEKLLLDCKGTSKTKSQAGTGKIKLKQWIY